MWCYGTPHSAVRAYKRQILQGVTCDKFCAMSAMNPPVSSVCHVAVGSEPTASGRFWRVSAAAYRVYELEEAEHRAVTLHQMLSVRCNLHSFSAVTYGIPYIMEHVGHETDDD